MSGNGRRIGTGLIAVLLAISGCNDTYDITTIIHPDGSCERIVSCTRDSRSLPTGAFHLPSGPSWDTTWTTEKKGETTQHVFTARRRFTDPDSLNGEISGKGDSASFAITLEVTRTFRWFYTYYSYRETYARFNRFYHLSPAVFMSGEEVRQFMTNPHPDSLLQKKWNEWKERNEQEFILSRLRAALASGGDSLLSPAELDARRGDLFAAWDSAKSNSGRKSRGDDEEGTAREAVRTMARVFRNDRLLLLQPAMKQIIREFLQAQEIQGRAEGLYRTTAVLPGTILETNAPEIEGNKVKWTFTQDQLATADITMAAESRMLNFWTSVVTAVAVVGILLGPSLSRLMRRGRPSPGSRG